MSIFIELGLSNCSKPLTAGAVSLNQYLLSRLESPVGKKQIKKLKPNLDEQDFNANRAQTCKKNASLLEVSLEFQHLLQMCYVVTVILRVKSVNFHI
jgi:hypothetical protein